jgi:hypothetical protein
VARGGDDGPADGLDHVAQGRASRLDRVCERIEGVRESGGTDPDRFAVGTCPADPAAHRRCWNVDVSGELPVTEATNGAKQDFGDDLDRVGSTRVVGDRKEDLSPAA